MGVWGEVALSSLRESREANLRLSYLPAADEIIMRRHNRRAYIRYGAQLGPKAGRMTCSAFACASWTSASSTIATGPGFVWFVQSDPADAQHGRTTRL